MNVGNVLTTLNYSRKNHAYFSINIFLIRFDKFYLQNIKYFLLIFKFEITQILNVS